MSALQTSLEPEHACKVMLVVSQLDLDGTERVAPNMTRYWADCGHD